MMAREIHPEPMVQERANLAGALAVEGRPLAVTVEDRAHVGTQPKLAEAFDASLRPGDTLTVTIGAETYYPVKFNGFTVGPLSATTVIRPNEKAGDAYTRVHNYLTVLFETELNIKRKQFRERLGEAE